MFKHTLRRLLPLGVISLALSAAGAAALGQAKQEARPPQRLSLIHKVQTASDTLEMTVNTSRILTMEQKIPQAQVNNPDLLDLTPLSPKEIQVSAKTAGVTQITLWGEDNKLYTIDVIIHPDAQALTLLLRSQFPSAALKVVPISHGVLISGFVDRAEHVDLIVRIAEEFYPKVINAMTVGGVQQVLLHVKVIEVSRTKLRRLGFDFTKVTGSNVVLSGISGLLRAPVGGTLASTGNETFSFSIVNGTSAFFGVLDALRQDNLAKVNAEPTLVTVSGRPASFNVGGEFPVPVPQSLGTISIEYKKYGTQLDFVPIVLGNGLIRLEVRPRVSEIDNSRTITLAGTTVPGLRTREAETGVELQAGQTIAIGGLIYHRTESMNRGLPWISEVPYLGAAFRRVNEETNEIELLILVTPELVDAMNACEVPPCAPGLRTTSPNDWELFMQGHLEVPNCCPTCDSGGAGEECAECSGNGGGPGTQAAPAGGNGSGEAIPAPPPNGAARARLLPAGRGAQQVAARPRPYARPTGPEVRNIRSNANASPAVSRSGARNSEPSFIGPVGYDELH